MKVQGNGGGVNIKQLLDASQNKQAKAAKGHDSDGDNDGAREASEAGKGENVNVTA